MDTHEKYEVDRIVKEFLAGRFSSKTEEKIQEWIIEDNNTEEKAQASFTYWDSLDIEPDADTYAALDRVNAKLNITDNVKKKVSLYRRFSRIAAVLIPFVLIIGGYVYYNSTQDDMIEVAVAYGEAKQMQLPDGSEIWINGGTTIKYPKGFNKDTRTVYLSGEAFFSVKRDESKPFVVQTNGLSIKVLGTKFNIKAYPDDQHTIATLNSGKIEVNTNNQKSRILEPNQQLYFDKQTSEINVIEIPAEKTMGRTGTSLEFTNASFEEIVQALEYVFKVSIEGDDAILKTKELYTVKFLKNENLDEILNILEDVVGDISYKRQGDKVIINKK